MSYILNCRIGLAVSFILCFSAYAQDIPVKEKFSHIEVSQGLSQSNVTDIIQDFKGFLWIGTSDGLNRYDGKEFIVYSGAISDSLGLHGTNILNLYEDHSKTLWVSTREGGLHYYDAQLDKFKSIRQFSSDCYIREITEDLNKNVWIAGHRQGFAFAAKRNLDGSWEMFNILKTGEYVTSILPITENEFWMGIARTGLFVWNSNTNTFSKTFRNDPFDQHSIVSSDIMKITRTSDSSVWIGTRGGLAKYLPQTEKFINFTKSNSTESIRSNTVVDIIPDKNTLWIGTENGGLSRLDLSSNTFKNYSFDKNDPYSLSDNSVWAVYKDFQDRIWVGTFSRGLCLLDKGREKFFELDVPLENDIVNAIWVDKKGRIWIGTEGGLVMRDGKKIKTYVHNPAMKGSISSNPILCIYEDSRERMWFGTWDGGVNRYDEKNDLFVNYTTDPNNHASLSNPNVYSITQDKETGRMLFGSYKGLNILIDEDKGIFENHIDILNDANNYIRTLKQDENGIVWIGSVGGLSKFNLKTGKRIQIAIGGDSTKVGIVNNIFRDSRKRLWVAATNGLHLRIDSLNFKSYTKREGLPGNSVLGIMEDQNNDLWLTTTQGLSKFSSVAGEFTNYDISDGLLSNEFKHNAFFNYDNKQFFVGGKGVNVFYPDSITISQHKTQVYFTSLKVLNRLVEIGDSTGILKKQIGELEEISIPPTYNFFTISYSGVNLTAGNKNQYAYFLQGFSDAWNYVGNQRQISFTNLDPGTYIFQVKASNNDGVWSEDSTNLTIKILPPWWRTTWFKILCIFLFATSITSAFRIRTHQVRKRNLMLKHLVEKRTEQLHESKTKIEKQNRKLREHQEELAAQNEELVQTQEEISAQRDLVAMQNIELTSARDLIQKQNQEIQKKNEGLEDEVEKRTKELVEYNHQLEQFAFIAAHNLRSPVARILGLGNLLRLSQEKMEIKEIVNRIVHTTTDLDRVVHDLNTVLEIRRDNTSIITSVDLNQEMANLNASLENEILETGAIISFDFTKVSLLNSIKPYITSIFLNLLGNSIKYRHPDRQPMIWITSESEEGYICLTFTDNGLGIDLQKYDDKIFSLYQRFHSHVEGKGLGLYIVKTQVSALGGKITVESQVNKGTTFKIFLKQ